MEGQLTFSVTLHEEELEGRNVFVADCIELGISDFGDSIDEVIDNLKNSITLLLEEAPEKKRLLQRNEPVLITRVAL